MIRLGLVGYPISHSLSPRLHASALEALDLEGEYKLYQVAPGDNDGLVELIESVRSGSLNGLNVTIPYKQTVIPLLDDLTPYARSIGAVNTIYLSHNRLIGHNTDAPGFLVDLAGLWTDHLHEKRSLVLGAGGAARAVVYALLKEGWTVTLAVRRDDLDQAAELIESFKYLAGDRPMSYVLLELETLKQHEDGIRLIVNATPVGVLPNIELSPWPVGLPFPPGVVVYDVIYNPRQTRLVKDARTAGLRAKTGLGMLVEQAALSFECWTGLNVPREVMFTAVEEKCCDF
jgi:shikimate dehydrogenase